LLNAPCDAGDYSLRPSLAGFSCQVYVLKVRIGSVTSMIKMQVQNRKKNRGGSFLDKSRGSNAKQGLLKKHGVGDMLFCRRTGYDTGYQMIPSYTGTADFLLDKILVVLDSVNYTQHGNFIIVSHSYQISRYFILFGKQPFRNTMTQSNPGMIQRSSPIPETACG